jgi:hypothetical protein
MVPTSKGTVVDTSGPGQHVPVVERKIQTIQQCVRCYENSLPCLMIKLLLIMCVTFCVSCINLQPCRTLHDRISPLEQFSGRKLDASRDLRINFGDYVHATVPDPDSTMKARTQGCVALLNAGNSTEGVTMWCLATNRIVKRDQFKKLPMPDLIAHINSTATSEGYTRGSEPDNGPLESDPRDLDILSLLPSMMALHDDTGIVHLADSTSLVPDEGVNEPEPAATTTMDGGSSTTSATAPAADTTDEHVANQDAANETSGPVGTGRNRPSNPGRNGTQYTTDSCCC